VIALYEIIEMVVINFRNLLFSDFLAMPVKVQKAQGVFDYKLRAVFHLKLLVKILLGPLCPLILIYYYFLRMPNYF